MRYTEPAGAPAVRAARREDLPRVWTLLLGLAEYERWTERVTGTRDELEEALFGPAPAAECLVAEHAGRIVGYALVFPTFSSFQARRCLWLEDLFVEERARGSGAGRALLAAVVRLALERGYARVDWLVLDWNEPAIGFYRRMGAGPSAEGTLQFGLGREALERIAAGAAPDGRTSSVT